MLSFKTFTQLFISTQKEFYYFEVETFNTILQEEYSSTPEDEDKAPVVNQPGSVDAQGQGYEGGAAIPMPPPEGMTENTTLTADPKPHYGADSSSLDRQEGAQHES